MPLLSDTQISEGLTKLPGWRRRDQVIEKAFTLPTFPDAVAFVVRVAFAAEAVDHHPDISIHYRQVTLTYWTHSEGGITHKDLSGAGSVETLMAAGAGL